MQSVEHPTRARGPSLVSPSADSGMAVVNYWGKYVLLVYCIGGLSVSRNSVGRLTDSSDMTTAVYSGCITTKQQQTQNSPEIKIHPVGWS